MKTIYTIAILFIGTSVIAQSNFEGVITMKTMNDAMKETASVTWYLKNGDSRLEINSQAGEFNKQFAVISDSKGMDLVAEGEVTRIPEIKLVNGKTALRLETETKDVQTNGFNCTKQVYSDGNGETIYWMAENVGIGFNDLPSFIKRNMPTIVSNGFPVRMEKRDGTGKVILSQDVVSITPASVDVSKFERR